MRTTADFLDLLRVELQLDSDGQLAKYFGVKRQMISRYRTNAGSFDDLLSLRVAEILDLDGAYVMACMHYQREERPTVKNAWKHTAEVLYGMAASWLFALVIFASPFGSVNEAQAAPLFAQNSPALYIMSNWIRALIRSLSCALHQLRQITARVNLSVSPLS